MRIQRRGQPNSNTRALKIFLLVRLQTLTQPREFSVEQAVAPVRCTFPLGMRRDPGGELTPTPETRFSAARHYYES